VSAHVCGLPLVHRHSYVRSISSVIVSSIVITCRGIKILRPRIPQTKASCVSPPCVAPPGRPQPLLVRARSDRTALTGMWHQSGLHRWSNHPCGMPLCSCRCGRRASRPFLRNTSGPQAAGCRSSARATQPQRTTPVSSGWRNTPLPQHRLPEHVALAAAGRSVAGPWWPFSEL
jgi:hypothetical protein